MNAHRIDNDNVDGDNMNVDGINVDNVDDDTVNVDGVSDTNVDVRGGVHGGVAKAALVNKGFADWTHLSTRLKEHEVGLEHIRNIATWFDMRLRVKKNEAIDNVVHEQFDKERYHWMKVLLRIIPIVKFLAKHNLALCGSTCVTVEESLLGFLSVDDTTGQGLFDVTRDKLKSLDLDIDDVRGQGYDNGSNMKGKHRGVQNKFLDINPRAFYTSCGCHSLNLTFHINLVSKKLQSDDMLIDVVVKEVEGLIAFFEEFRKQIFDENSLDGRYKHARAVEVAFKVQYFLYIVDQALVSLRTRFEQYKEYERVFGFFFTSSKLNSFDDNTLKSHCSNLEAALKNNEQSDVDAKDLFVELSTNPQKDNNQKSKGEGSRVSLRSCGGVGHTCLGPDTSLVGQPRATDKGAIKCLISTATGIHNLRHTSDHPGRDLGLLGDRALNNSLQA
ncbi:zinc finger MYM-type protein 1 [Tanacetum coccineum]